jgi:hypothetical protein
VVDLSNGNVVNGPGQVKDTSASNDNVVVVSTPAETKPKAAAALKAAEPTPVQEPTPVSDHQTELKDLMQRLVSIERNLSNCCTTPAPSAGKCDHHSHDTSDIDMRTCMERSLTTMRLSCRYDRVPWL